MKKWIVIIWIAALLTLNAGCGTDAQQEQVSSSPAAGDKQQNETNTGDSDQAASPYLTFHDLNGATVTLEKKPERIVILNNELTELFYQVGGEAFGIATSAGVDIPAEAADVKQVSLIKQHQSGGSPSIKT
ncbi:hypothetical protein BK131_11710 [Paenibacillus amylolyticus]|uniref:Uncharacterized protein n=1 Tax=Paenibacillus amylolyticus TaxID=1451 RepID=A0A1R1C065_PAEAM|nr:ABC transporter substrate-binding protein [Paenibacillus amylolyticus]OMF15520.1 hypothetical protein BK131_11710 [Paenibacillus amylolyticus]